MSRDLPPPHSSSSSDLLLAPVPKKNKTKQKTNSHHLHTTFISFEVHVLFIHPPLPRTHLTRALGDPAPVSPPQWQRLPSAAAVEPLETMNPDKRKEGDGAISVVVRSRQRAKILLSINLSFRLHHTTPPPPPPPSLSLPVSLFLPAPLAPPQLIEEQTETSIHLMRAATPPKWQHASRMHALREAL